VSLSPSSLFNIKIHLHHTAACVLSEIFSFIYAGCFVQQ